MRCDNAVCASLVIMGLCASLTFGLSACGSTSNEGSSEPIGEEMFGGDNWDEAPVHQEKMRRASSDNRARYLEAKNYDPSCDLQESRHPL